MNLSSVVSSYIDHKRALGCRFKTEDHVLKAFIKTVGDAPIAEIESSSLMIQAFLDGRGPPTPYWAKKYHVLKGLYRFAIARGLVSVSPLPKRIPLLTGPAFVPYIYSEAELKRLLCAVPTACGGRVPIDGDVYRTLLLLLYGAGLRISEALSLTMADVDLTDATLRVRETKFFKTRIVPLGTDLTKILLTYASKRNIGSAAIQDAPFFCFKDGRRISRSAAQSTFRRLRTCAGISREGGANRQPRLHDLRHSAAVHRLLAWYRSGADLQDLLPKLSTYLGHVDLSATQRYLAIIPEMLREASGRFERYALEANDD
jgi:site-specific recombinase XerD